MVYLTNMHIFSKYITTVIITIIFIAYWLSNQSKSVVISQCVPLLHDTAHGVYSTVSQVSSQHFTHQLKTRPDKNNNSEVKTCFWTAPWMWSHTEYLPAGFTELLHVNRSAQCDDEQRQRVGGQAVITHHSVQHLQSNLHTHTDSDTTALS